MTASCQSSAGIIATHAAALPPHLAENPVSLGEGNTPLLRLEHLPGKWGLDLEIWCKFEGANPTGSFKDRGMAAAVTAARHDGAQAVVCASTGNTSASAAAYAARAGLSCVVLLPSGKVAAGKLAQAVAHGAKILTVKGNFDDAMHAVQQFDTGKVAIVNSINPMRIQGQKTIAYEIAAQLGRLPDVHALPVGNAGNITAHWIGYSELAGQPTRACGSCQGDCPYPPGDATAASRPRMLGVQASGAAPFLAGAPVPNPETVATAIRIGNPQSWDGAQAAVAESSGAFMAVDDEALLATQKELADSEGIFCEPASAAGLAGVRARAAAGELAKGLVVVCTLTGHGLKDPEIFASADSIEVGTDPNEILAAAGVAG